MAAAGSVESPGPHVEPAEIVSQAGTWGSKPRLGREMETKMVFLAQIIGAFATGMLLGGVLTLAILNRRR